MRRPSEPRSRRGVSVVAWLMLIALLVFPAIAVARLTDQIDNQIILGWLIIVSLITFRLYGQDKRSAEAQEWRVPEATLHLFEALGGWPAAFLAQRIFRHKTIKVSYQLTFWLIVAIHQCVALAILLDDGSLRRGLGISLQSNTHRRPAVSSPVEHPELPIVVPGPAGRDRL